MGLTLRAAPARQLLLASHPIRHHNHEKQY